MYCTYLLSILIELTMILKYIQNSLSKMGDRHEAFWRKKWWWRLTDLFFCLELFQNGSDKLLRSLLWHLSKIFLLSF